MVLNYIAERRVLAGLALTLKGNQEGNKKTMLLHGPVMERLTSNGSSLSFRTI